MTRKNNEKRSFVFYDSFLEAMKHLNDAEFRECVLKIRDYALEGIEDESEYPMVNIILALAKPNLEAARRRYVASIENGKKGAEFGKLGGAPKGNQNARKKQPLKQPLDVDDNVDVEEDVNENEEVDVNEDTPVGDIVPSSFSNSSNSVLREEIENDSERFEERSAPLQEDKKEENPQYSKANSNTPVNPGSGSDAESLGARLAAKHKEYGISIAESVKRSIDRDIALLGEMALNGEECDKIILNRAIDNLIALYGRHDRKSGYGAILSAVERYVENNT